MKKFLVISENSNEYLIGIRNPIFDYYTVGVYVKKKIFGIPYNTKVNNEELGGSSWYEGNKYNYDFVKMARVEIIRLEAVLAEELRREKLRVLGVTRFKGWDGKC